MAKTSKVTVTMVLTSVQYVKHVGKYLFCAESNINGFKKEFYHFFLSDTKALAIANENVCFPLGAHLKISGRFSTRYAGQLNHVNIISIDGIETTAWSQRVGSPTVAPEILNASQQRFKDAIKAEDEIKQAQKKRRTSSRRAAIMEQKAKKAAALH